MEDKKKHNFWDKQCIINYENNEEINTNDYLDLELYSKLKKMEITKLPEICEWVTLEFEKYEEQIYNFYENNYGPFISKDILNWELTKVKKDKECSLFIIDKTINNIVGGIFQVPIKLKIHEKKIDTHYVFYLCVDKDLRNIKIASSLINEIIRKIVINNKKITSLYIAFNKLPNALNKNDICLYKFPLKILKGGIIDNINLIEMEDYNDCLNKLNDYNKKFKLGLIINDISDFKDIFINKVVKSFVIKDKYGKITDFISFYELYNKNKNTREIKLYYYFLKKYDLYDLVKYIIHYGKINNYDIISFFDCMDYYYMKDKIDLDLNQFKLSAINYYLYNWKCKKMDNYEIGIITGV